MARWSRFSGWVLAFCPKILGGGRGLRMIWGYHEVVDTLKHYLMQNNLFDFFVLTDSRDARTSNTSTQTIDCTRATMCKYSWPNFFNWAHQNGTLHISVQYFLNKDKIWIRSQVWWFGKELTNEMKWNLTSQYALDFGSISTVFIPSFINSLCSFLLYLIPCIHAFFLHVFILYSV